MTVHATVPKGFEGFKFLKFLGAFTSAHALTADRYPPSIRGISYLFVGVLILSSKFFLQQFRKIWENGMKRKWTYVLQVLQESNKK